MHKVFKKHYEVFLKRSFNDKEAVPNFYTHINTFKRNLDIKDGDILHRFPKKELRYFARSECPIERLQDKRGVNPDDIIHASKRIRFYLNIPENFVCSRCTKRESCNLRDIVPRSKNTSVSDLLIMMNGLYDYQGFLYNEEETKDKEKNSVKEASGEEELDEAAAEGLENESDQDDSEGPSKLSEDNTQEASEGNDSNVEEKIEDRYSYKTYDSALKLVDTLYPIFQDIDARKGFGCKQYINTYIGENKKLHGLRSEELEFNDLSDEDEGNNRFDARNKAKRRDFDAQGDGNKEFGYGGKKREFRNQERGDRDFRPQEGRNAEYGSRKFDNRDNRDSRDQGYRNRDFRGQERGERDFKPQEYRKRDFGGQDRGNRDFRSQTDTDRDIGSTRKPQRESYNNSKSDQSGEFEYQPKPYQYQKKPSRPDFEKRERSDIPYKKRDDQSEASWGTKPEGVARRGQSFDSSRGERTNDFRSSQKFQPGSSERRDYKSKDNRDDDYNKFSKKKEYNRRDQDSNRDDDYNKFSKKKEYNKRDEDGNTQNFKARNNGYDDTKEKRGPRTDGGKVREERTTAPNFNNNRGDDDVREKRVRNVEDSDIREKPTRNFESFAANETENQQGGRKLRNKRSFGEKIKERGDINIAGFMSDVKE